jgi:hypothetical protein
MWLSPPSTGARCRWGPPHKRLLYSLRRSRSAAPTQGFVLTGRVLTAARPAGKSVPSPFRPPLPSMPPVRSKKKYAIRRRALKTLFFCGSASTRDARPRCGNIGASSIFSGISTGVGHCRPTARGGWGSNDRAGAALAVCVRRRGTPAPGNCALGRCRAAGMRRKASIVGAGASRVRRADARTARLRTSHLRNRGRASDHEGR